MKTGKRLSAIIVVALCLDAGAGSARAQIVTVEGLQYDITVVNCTFTDNETLLESQPWWGNLTLANEFALDAAQTSPYGQAEDFAVDNNDTPFAPYTIDYLYPLNVAGFPGAIELQNDPADDNPYAIATVVPEPTALTIATLGIIGLWLKVPSSRFQVSG